MDFYSTIWRNSWIQCYLTRTYFLCIRSLRERGQTFKHESSKYQSEISYTSPLFEHIRCLMLKVNGNGCGIICHGFLNKLNSTSILVVIVVVGADDFRRCCSPVMNLRNIHSFTHSLIQSVNSYVMILSFALTSSKEYTCEYTLTLIKCHY